MRGHRILTLFAVEAAAMFALCAATSIPAASSASAATAGHLKAAAPMSADQVPGITRYEPGPGDDRGHDDGDGRDGSSRTRQQDDTAVRVKVHQNQHSRSRHHSRGEQSSPVCIHCQHRHHHARPRMHHAPQAPVSLPVTGGNSTRMAVGGGAAVLTGVVLLWLSSVRRREVLGSKPAGGVAA